MKGLLLRRARELEAAGLLEEAIKVYDELIYKHSDDPSLFNLYGDLLLRYNKQREAIEKYYKAEEIYEKEKFTEHSVAILKKILRINPEERRALLKLIDFYLSEQILPEARFYRNLYMKYLKEGKFKVGPVVILKDLNKLIKEFDNDLDFIKEASEIALSFPERIDISDFLYSIATIMEKNNRIDEAIRLYKDIIERNPHYYKAYYALARLTDEPNYFEKAREEAEKHLLSESDMDATVILAEIYKRMGDTSRAASYLIRAGEYALSKNQIDEAKKYFLHAYEIDPNNIEALEKYITLADQGEKPPKELAQHYLTLAKFYLSRGNVRKARSLLERVIKIDPELKAARKILERLDGFAQLKELTFKGRNLMDRAFTLGAIDPLTNLPTAYEFYDRVFDRMEVRQPFVLGFLQIDNLSTIGRMYGESAVKQVLSGAAHFLQLRLKNAFLSRHDDVTFGIIWDEPNGDTRKIMEQLDWIREEFKSLSFIKEYPEYHVTFSAGITGYDGRLKLSDLIKSAERALVEAQKSGDTVVIAEEIYTTAGHEGELPDLSVFVDRQQEFNRLFEALNASREGKYHGVVIHGETGIGKSRLLKEFSVKLDEQTTYVIKARALRHKTLTPFYPFYTGFAEFFGSLPRREKDMVIGATGGYPPIFGGGEERAAEDRHFALYEWISRFMDFVAEENKQFVFLIDDLTWVDDPSLELISYILRNGRPGTFLVMTYSDTDLPQGSPIKETLNSLIGERVLEDIVLGPLDKDAVREFLLKAMHAQQVPEKAVEYFRRETNGNPFLLGELLTLMYEQGNIKKVDRKLEWHEPERLTYTNKLAEIAEKRIQSLDEQTLSVLQTVACIGRAFSFDLLTEIFKDLTEDELIDALEKAQKALIIREASGFGVDYEFVNEQIRQYIYDRINPVKRKRIHKKIAEYLEKKYLTGKEQLVHEISYHYFNAEIADKALFYMILSGEKALSDYMFAEALNYFNRAYELYKNYESELEPDFVLRLFLGRAKSLEVMGRYDEAEETLREALNIVPDSPKIFNAIGEIKLARSMFDEALEAFQKAYELSIDDVDKARTLVNIGKTYFIQTKYDEAIKALTEAEQMLLELEEKPLLSEVQLFIGAVMRARGDLPGAKINYKEALDAASSVNDVRGEIHALNNLGSVLRSMGELTEAEKVFSDALERAQRISDIRAEIVALNNMGMLLKDRGSLRQAIEIFEGVIDRSDKLGYKDSIAIANIELSEIYYLMGNFERAEEHASKAIKVADELGKKHYKAMALRNIALSKLYQGEFKQALEFIDQSEKEIGHLYSIEYVPLIGLARGDAYYRMKKFSEAIFAYRDTLNRVESTEIKKVKTMALASLVNIYLEVNELLDAEKSLLEAEMNIGDSAIAEANIRYSIARARVNMTKKLLMEALEDIENALSLIDSSGMKLYLPEALLHKAIIEKHRGEVEAAHKSLSDAYEAAAWIRASGIIWEIARTMIDMNHPRSREVEKELDELMRRFKEQGDEFVPRMRLSRREMQL